MNRKRVGTILVSALLILAAFTIAVNDVSAASSPSLGAAARFAVLAHTTVTNVPTSIIIGDVGLSPAAGSSYGAGLTTAQVTGTIYAVDSSGPAGAAGNNPILLTAATGAVVTAYGALASQACDVDYGPGSVDLVNLSLAPGVYCAGDFALSGTLTLTGSGVWIFKTYGASPTLVTSGTANVVGGDPCNVWWYVASSATLGVNTQLTGNILALTAITLNAGARLNGRALVQTAAVTLSSNTINGAVCSVASTTIFSTTLSRTTFGGGSETITTLTTIVMYGLGLPAVGGVILPGDTSQPLSLVAILIAAAAIGLGVMYKRRIR